jgi:phosphoglycolate phosphatase
MREEMPGEGWAGAADRRGGYRCLVADHDDTAVRSTPEIHYPAYLAMLEVLRPGSPALSLEGFYLALQGGFDEHLRRDLAFTDDEVREEQRIWRSFVEARVPGFYPGFVEVLRGFSAGGGRIAVVSHSDEGMIRRDYAMGAPGLELDAVYGWSEEESRRKPSPRPLEELAERFGLERGSMLVVDDLRPGALMARRAGVDVAAAGWAHRVPEIERTMRRECTYYLETVGELADALGVGRPGRGG